VELPKMTGFQFMKAFREEYGYDAMTNIIMLSERADKESVKKAMTYQVADFLVKPFHISPLLHKVSRWINSGVEKSWSKLKPENEKVLRITMSTLDKTWDSITDGSPVVYADFAEVGKLIVNTTDQKDVRSLLDALKDHDAYTFVHSLRTGIFIAMLSRVKLGYMDEELQTVAAGGVMHDLGKARTPLGVLNKGGGFEPEEWNVMKEHVNHTVAILSAGGNVPQPVIEIAWSHHEKLDGSGYPRKLKDAQIGPLARLAAIADAYVALTDRRVYKPAFSLEKTFQILEGATNHFDQELVKAFKEITFKYS
jgi:HD-GYP domain-containing protein (c-di-GMP phosphodiesterase class II)